MTDDLNTHLECVQNFVECVDHEVLVDSDSGGLEVFVSGLDGGGGGLHRGSSSVVDDHVDDDVDVGDGEEATSTLNLAQHPLVVHILDDVNHVA